MLAIERMIGATINAIKPETLNPGTKREANQKQRPLTIRENPPRLKMFKGKDRIDKTGFTPEFTKPIAKPAIIATGKLARLTPGKMMSTTKRLSAVAKTVNNEPNIFFDS